MIFLLETNKLLINQNRWQIFAFLSRIQT